MKIPILALDGKQKGETSLGKAFSTPVRTDIIKRAFLAEAAARRQPYGTDPLAGKRTSAHYHGLRHYRYTMMNREMARMTRIHSQGYLNYTARIVPQAIKGREAHPPLVERNWKLKVNKKERRMALLSALAATAAKEFTSPRYTGAVPIVLEDGFQKLTKTKDVVAVVRALGLVAGSRSIRAGRGKTRGRKYRSQTGPLFIVKEGPVLRAAPPGCDVLAFKDVDMHVLAPGGRPGRLCVWTESALKEAEALAK
ncbi:MAG: 50S ribosomal protein L4 [Candidatus Aenigmarchaeota archaeon]|nr:50S ribosomal protein L4 [Candidatus Aenigmarchaeota archaeon]